MVAFNDNNETLIGEAAKNQTASNPERTIFEVKRLMGRQFDDEEVQKAIQDVPYRIVNKQGKPFIEVKSNNGETRFFSPEEISALILCKMKETAEAFLGEKIRYALITIPEYFNDPQRRAMRKADAIAGFNPTFVINEPDAAAVAYGFETGLIGKKVLVFNLGGRTFDASILRYEAEFLIVSTYSADIHLGGVDFDQRVTEYLINLIKNKYGKDISSNTSD